MSAPAALAKIVGRRGILALLGVAPAVVALGKQVPNHGNLVGGMGAPPRAVKVGTADDDGLWTFQRKFWKSRERMIYRLDGYSIDVHAMRSWSPGFKALTQLKRDEEDKGAWKRLAESLGFKDWEP